MWVRRQWKGRQAVLQGPIGPRTPFSFPFLGLVPLSHAPFSTGLSSSRLKAAWRQRQPPQQSNAVAVAGTPHSSATQQWQQGSHTAARHTSYASRAMSAWCSRSAFCVKGGVHRRVARISALDHMWADLQATPTPPPTRGVGTCLVGEPGRAGFGVQAARVANQLAPGLPPLLPSRLHRQQTTRETASSGSRTAAPPAAAPAIPHPIAHAGIGTGSENQLLTSCCLSRDRASCCGMSCQVDITSIARQPHLVLPLAPPRLLLRRLQRGAGDGVGAKLQVAGGQRGEVRGVYLRLGGGGRRGGEEREGMVGDEAGGR